MLPHYRGEFRSSKCRTNLEENTNKKCHINQLSFHSYQQKSHEQSLSLPSLLFCRSMKGVQTVKKHKNFKKSNSSVLPHAWHRLDHSVIDNATNEWR